MLCFHPQGEPFLVLLFFSLSVAWHIYTGISSSESVGTFGKVIRFWLGVVGMMKV